MIGAQPNIILLVADDMGYGDLGLFNEGRCRTSSLDALARDGACLTQHYSGSPVCAPARAALLTGRYPHRTGAIDTLQGRGLDRIALSETTVADLFRSAGYKTGLVGKWHNGALDPRYHPNARGFEEFVGFSGGFCDYYQYRLDVNGTDVLGDGRYMTDVFTEHAMAFVRRHANEPFLLVVAYNAPHFPMQAPADLVYFYRGQGEAHGAALVYAMIEAMDRGIGQIDELLHDLKLREQTIVIFTSDNGPYLGAVDGISLDRFNYGLRGAKHYVFEGGIRVPAIVRWPGRVPEGLIISELLHFTDWLPTMAGVAGIKLPDRLELDGRDVSRVIAGDSSDVNPVRFWQNNRYAPHGEGNAAMRDGDWKFVRPWIAATMQVTDRDRAVDQALNLQQPDRIEWVDRTPLPSFDVGCSPAPMLFNLVEDPFEQVDLASEHSERVARMSAALDDWFAEVESERARIADDWDLHPQGL